MLKTKEEAHPTKLWMWCYSWAKEVKKPASVWKREERSSSSFCAPLAAQCFCVDFTHGKPSFSLVDFTLLSYTLFRGKTKANSRRATVEYWVVFSLFIHSFYISHWYVQERKSRSLLKSTFRQFNTQTNCACEESTYRYERSTSVDPKYVCLFDEHHTRRRNRSLRYTCESTRVLFYTKSSVASVLCNCECRKEQWTSECVEDYRQKTWLRLIMKNK